MGQSRMMLDFVVDGGVVAAAAFVVADVGFVERAKKKMEIYH